MPGDDNLTTGLYKIRGDMQAPRSKLSYPPLEERPMAFDPLLWFTCSLLALALLGQLAYVAYVFIHSAG